jgi:hypothetical protein
MAITEDDQEGDQEVVDSNPATLTTLSDEHSSSGIKSMIAI